ncbi:uncharacterized protein LOC118348883 [Juglans regia]|uniref:Uncharacterized protein LOC118348883 n=1 Tax=Juglans regia TaxID=51240 RepID=A0A6P9EIJ2_JUGRE|nr:uncharacterized protein LOC118348883 [Juglans regia]
MSYYEAMFKLYAQPCNLDFLASLRGRVTTEMNEELTKAFTDVELEECIFSSSTSTVFFLGIQQYQNYDKYLSLPPMIGKDKKRAFSDIKHKFWSKLQQWKGKLLSQGGKETLIKAVALAIPTYAMSCFKLPLTLCNELEQMMAKFWWRWRIGNGMTVRIWEDYWIPGFNNLQQLGGTGRANDQGVEELIDLSTGWWDVQKVRRMLPHDPADAVLKIILSATNHEDKLIWDKERNGCFSVRSAYKCFRNQAIATSEGESSLNSTNKKLWKQIWRMKLGHAGIEGINVFLKRNNSPLRKPSAQLSLHWTYKATKALDISRARRISQWQPPPQGSIKLNVDGAVFHAESKAKVGLIARDWEGKVLMAVSQKEEAVMEPLEIELLALLRGLQFSIPLGLQSLCIETDSLLLVKALPSNASYGNVITDIQELKCRFLNCSINHINREANQAAHKLARFSRNVSNTTVWWESVPNCVQPVLWTDFHL